MSVKAAKISKFQFDPRRMGATETTKIVNFYSWPYLKAQGS